MLSSPSAMTPPRTENAPPMDAKISGVAIYTGGQNGHQICQKNSITCFLLFPSMCRMSLNQQGAATKMTTMA